MDDAVTATTTTASPQFPGDMVIFTEEILYGKLHFLCSYFHKKGKQQRPKCNSQRRQKDFQDQRSSSQKDARQW